MGVVSLWGEQELVGLGEGGSGCGGEISGGGLCVNVRVGSLA